VILDTPAARAEIRAGDRLLRINGMTVDALTPLELQDTLSRPGVTLALEMRRGDQVVVISLALVKRI
jgi:C-terminal processing protease CtpA/Prc